MLFNPPAISSSEMADPLPENQLHSNFIESPYSRSGDN